MPKKQNIFKHVWRWLLDIGIGKAMVVINSIWIFEFIAIMWLLNWFHKHH